MVHTQSERISKSTDILGIFNKKHHPEITMEEYDPILPEELIVSKEDIPIRIECEIMAGLCMSLMGDNIETTINALNKHFNKNVKILSLVRDKKEHIKLKKHIKTNKKYKDGVLYPKGYFNDNVHWYYGIKNLSFDGYTQMKQMDGGHQFCQGHAIALAYLPEYRYTYDAVKDKKWFMEDNLLGAYREAYIDIMDHFNTLLPIIFRSFSKKQLIHIINQLIKDQYIDKDDGGEDPRYYKMVHDSILEFLKLFIKKPALTKSKKNNYIPVIKQKGTNAKLKEDMSKKITNYIVNILTQEWAMKYMSVGYYVDYDKINYNPFAEDEYSEDESSEDEN